MRVSRKPLNVPSDEFHEVWHHTEILLEPLNSAYDDIRVSPEEADSVKFVAELVRVF